MPSMKLATKVSFHDISNHRLNIPSKQFQEADMLISTSPAGSKAFKIHFCADKPAVVSSQGVTLKADMDWEDAEDRLDEFDVLAFPGGNAAGIERNAKSQPIPLIRAYVELQKKDPSKERTIFSVCTGSIFLAVSGILQGLAATTHPDYYTKLESLCQMAAIADTGIRTDVMEERYVVNNARFDLGDDTENNPFILSKRPDPQRRKSSARRGSEAFKLSRRRESLVKRTNMPLGGMRVITSGGVTAGMDAALYLVAAMTSVECASEVARVMQFSWQKGVTVDAIDV